MKKRSAEPKPKAEALDALRGVKTMLLEDQPLNGIARRLLITSIDYAIEKVGEIAELQRARRASPLTKPPAAD